jgi:hypothetical protein
MYVFKKLRRLHRNHTSQENKKYTHNIQYTPLPANTKQNKKKEAVRGAVCVGVGVGVKSVLSSAIFLT